ncbi:hypothetical protein UG55_102127 [Frankia sp. EI5c]|uniref:SDR family NAD(P)-dependent oxidoreductase n=1 Tax=Frankia sp. EI5c TaxID=683316 RepID=UPI0007C2338D|nr:SDR family oxidoreductase [Frankia sp. EI5c]OAA25593.1 hypothetical protein UG55_102127 [Frankia sp. EI5c]
MTDFRGRTALVTGASSGIGAALAEALAARGADLVLSAPSEERLRPVASRLRVLHGVDVRMIPVDLAGEAGPDELAERTLATGREIDVLVNSAGFGTRGRYEELAAERDHHEVMVNVVAVERLTHRFVPAMVERGRGTVINVASTSGFQAVPYMAVYGASKAFVLSFSIALWAEYRSRGLQVLALCPGPTDTNFFEALGSRMSAGGRLRTTDEVVTSAFRALDRGQPYVIDGRLNYLTSNASRLLRRGFVAAVTSRVLGPSGRG